MDLSNKSKDQLLLLCEQYGITKCKSKNKSQVSWAFCILLKFKLAKN